MTRRLAAHPHLNISARLELRAPLRIMPSKTRIVELIIKFGNIIWLVLKMVDPQNHGPTLG